MSHAIPSAPMSFRGQRGISPLRLRNGRYSCDNRLMEFGFDWNAEKNLQLIAERGISFDDVVSAIEQGRLLDVRRHPNPERYPRQMVYYVEIDDYVYVVPLVVENDGIAFLKTMYPSRRATRDYLGR